ncbi:MAG: hypothetical protein AB1938_28180 [Myxococcota bacterium]
MMRRLWVVGAVALSACGAGNDGSVPWDQNHDGLITSCEGLSQAACEADASCEYVIAVCTQECRDDGNGGCLPCNAQSFCRPIAPPPPPDCGALPVALCGLVPACQVVTQEVCSGVTPPPEDPAVPAHRCGVPDGCTTISVCANRAPPRCEDLAVDACLTVPGCALEELAWACAAVCEDDGHGGCLPCPAPPSTLRCVTIPPPDVCGSRDPSNCGIDGLCTLESWACPAICEDDGHGGCLPCQTPPPRCVAVTPSTGGGSTPGAGGGSTGGGTPPPAP